MTGCSHRWIVSLPSLKGAKISKNNTCRSIVSFLIDVWYFPIMINMRILIKFNMSKKTLRIFLLHRSIMRRFSGAEIKSHQWMRNYGLLKMPTFWDSEHNHLSSHRKKMFILLGLDSLVFKKSEKSIKYHVKFLMLLHFKMTFISISSTGAAIISLQLGLVTAFISGMLITQKWPNYVSYKMTWWLPLDGLRIVELLLLDATEEKFSFGMFSMVSLVDRCRVMITELELWLGIQFNYQQGPETKLFFSEIPELTEILLQGWSNIVNRYVVLDGRLTNNTWHQEEMTIKLESGRRVVNSQANILTIEQQSKHWPGLLSNMVSWQLEEELQTEL